jgi:hypothetical protein
VKEIISESYNKNVSTSFKLKKSDKRRRGEDEDDAEKEKEETPPYTQSPTSLNLLSCGTKCYS